MTAAPGTCFAASYDLTTKIISAGACAVLLFVPLMAQSVVLGCLSALVILLAYGYSPRGYTVSERTITAKRLIGNVEVPLEGVREARAGGADDFRTCVRLWGSGGLFGYYGLHWTKKLRKCRWYVTNRKNTVVLVTEARTVVFSPDDVDGFLAAIRAAVPVSPPEVLPGTMALGKDRNRAGTIVGLTVGAASLAIVGLALSYSPGPPRYTLTHDALAIHDRFYPVTLRADAVDVARIRVVEITADPDWRPTLRTNGFSNSHYHSGWYRTASGRKMRMYRADGKRLVLLPPKGGGAPVLVEVKDPEGFIEALRRAW